MWFHLGKDLIFLGLSPYPIQEVLLGVVLHLRDVYVLVISVSQISAGMV